jgi:hypothetical protein
MFISVTHLQRCASTVNSLPVEKSSIEPRRLKRHDSKQHEFMVEAAETKQMPLAKPARIHWCILQEDGERFFLLGGLESC